MELFPPRPRPRLTPRFWLGAAAVILLANGLVLAIPHVMTWLGGPTRPTSFPEFDDRTATRVLSISAHPAPPPRFANRPHALHLAIMLLAVNALVVAGLAFSVFARYLEELRRYRLCLPTGFDERRLKRRHQRPAGIHLSSPSGSRFHRFDPPEGEEADEDEDDELH